MMDGFIAQEHLRKICDSTEGKEGKKNKKGGQCFSFCKGHENSSKNNPVSPG